MGIDLEAEVLSWSWPQRRIPGGVASVIPHIIVSSFGRTTWPRRE